jgi:hypothetical protein
MPRACQPASQPASQRSVSAPGPGPLSLRASLGITPRTPIVPRDALLIRAASRILHEPADVICPRGSRLPTWLRGPFHGALFTGPRSIPLEAVTGCVHATAVTETPVSSMPRFSADGQPKLGSFHSTLAPGLASLCRTINRALSLGPVRNYWRGAARRGAATGR